MSDLAALAATLAASPGVVGKRDIAPAVAALGVGGDAAVPVGDDCAALPDPAGGWQLLACEGMIEGFVAAMPWFAGWSAIMVNLSDVAAMGGRPVAVVNALWADGEEQAAPVLQGMRDAAAAYGVPVVGGHTNLRARTGQLAVAVLGRAEHLLTSFDARPGDTLVMAVDLNGRWHDPHPFWDAASSAEPERLRRTLALLPEIAEEGWAHAAKDISQGGVIGTAAMLCECSRVGLEIDLDAVPAPSGADPARWLTAFPSFGYLFAASSAGAEALVARMRAEDIAAAAIGRFDETGRLALRQGGARAEALDLAGGLIGCAPLVPHREARA
ncbi:MAG: sll0787 family AIR synthase-like protein [Pseudomonadota bacterium]